MSFKHLQKYQSREPLNLPLGDMRNNHKNLLDPKIITHHALIMKDEQTYNENNMLMRRSWVTIRTHIIHEAILNPYLCGRVTLMLCAIKVGN